MSKTERPTEYSIAEVADKTGISRRTVRYYIQRGLIDPPLCLGRGRHYTPSHLEQINRVRRLQKEGIPLDHIERLFASGDEGTHPPEGPPVDAPAANDALMVTEATVVIRIPLVEGVRLELDASAQIPSEAMIEALAAACRRLLNPKESEHEPE